MIGLLLLYTFLSGFNPGAGTSCQLKFLEEPPKELNCNPYDGNQLWRLRMSCEVRTEVTNPIQYRVDWYQRREDGTVINHGQPELQKSNTVQRVAFGDGRINQIFDSSMIGDYWCQVTLTDSNMLVPTKSDILTIRHPNTYSSLLPVCSNIQSVRTDECLFPSTANEIINVPIPSSSTDIVPTTTSSSLSSSSSNTMQSASTSSSNIIQSASTSSSNIIQSASTSSSNIVQSSSRSSSSSITVLQPTTSSNILHSTTTTQQSSSQNINLSTKSLSTSSTEASPTNTALLTSSLKLLSSSKSTVLRLSTTVSPFTTLASTTSQLTTSTDITMSSTPPSLPPFGIPTETNNPMLSLVIALACSLALLVLVLLIILIILINKLKQKTSKGMSLSKFSKRLSKLSKGRSNLNKNKLTPYYVEPNNTIHLTMITQPIEHHNIHHSPVASSDSVHSYESLTTTTDYVSIYDTISSTIETGARNYTAINPSLLNNSVYADLNK